MTSTLTTRSPFSFDLRLDARASRMGVVPQFECNSDAFIAGSPRQGYSALSAVRLLASRLTERRDSAPAQQRELSWLIPKTPGIISNVPLAVFALRGRSA